MKLIKTKPRPVGRPTREESESRRRELLDTAVEVFSQLGYAGASIDHIAKAARVGKPTIYSHFGSKAGLLRATVEHVLLRRVTPIDQPIVSTTGEEAIIEVISNILSACLAPPFLGLFRIFLMESAHFPPVFDAFSPEAHTNKLLIEQFDRFDIFEQLRNGKLDAARNLLEMTGMVVVNAATQPNLRLTLNPKAEAERIVSVVLHGILQFSFVRG